MMALIRKWIAGLLIKNVRAFKSPSGACARAQGEAPRAPTCVDARNSGCYYVTPLIYIDARGVAPPRFNKFKGVLWRQSTPMKASHARLRRWATAHLLLPYKGPLRGPYITVLGGLAP